MVLTLTVKYEILIMATYISPKVEVRDSPIEFRDKIGQGVFAKEKILKGEVVFDFKEGTGKYITSAEMDKLFEEDMDYGIQVGDNLFFAATEAGEMEVGDYLNHSCSANLGIKDSLKMVAMRDIEPNKEVAFDYAMSEYSDFTIKCFCGNINCRGVITGDDWKKKDLQERYKGYFSDYLQEKINQLTHGSKDR